MSIEAVHWALSQKGLHPATKLLLIHLADRHNPDLGCFPSQNRLAADAECSRATVNRHLYILEEMKLIKRVRRPCKKTGKRLATQYFLAFEDIFDQIKH